MRNRVLAFILMTVACQLAHAIGNMQSVEIAGVFVREDRTDIFIVGNHNNPLGCSIANELIISSSRFPNSKAMLVAAMAAHVAGKRISGWIIGCADSRAELSAIFVEK